MTEQVIEKKQSRKNSIKTKIFFFVVVAGFIAFNSEYLEFLFYYKYVCLHSAIDAGNGQKLGVCDRRVHDNGGGGIPYDTAIIFDSSDQLLLPDKNRSPQWLAAAEKLNMRRNGIKVSQLNDRPFTPTMMDTFDAITPIGTHFYHVNGVGSY